MNKNQILVTFKDVGQGDSIIVEWYDRKILKIGIIDCNKYLNMNPVIEYLEQKSEPYLVDFLILSHPHSDHYSGFLDLLNYLEQKSISVGCFYHTAIYTKEFLASATHFKNKYLDSVLGINEKSELKKLFTKLHKLLKEKSILKETDIIDNKTSLELNKIYSLYSLSPSHGSELTDYMNGNVKSEDSFIKTGNLLNNNNPKTNHISTILSLRPNNKNWQFLLFSDAPKVSIKRILEIRGEEYFQDMILAQAPHHGSINNHYEKFWDGIKRKKQIPVLISVGEGYGHPSKGVIKYYAQNFKNIYATNNVGGYSEYFNQFEKPITSSFLKHASKLNKENKVSDKRNGDIKVLLDKEGIVKVSKNEDLK